MCLQYSEASTEGNTFSHKKSTGKPAVPATSERKGRRLTNPLSFPSSGSMGGGFVPHRPQSKCPISKWSLDKHVDMYETWMEILGFSVWCSCKPPFFPRNFPFALSESCSVHPGSLFPGHGNPNVLGMRWYPPGWQALSCAAGSYKLCSC